MTRWLIRAGISGVVIAILLSFIPVEAVTEALRRTSVWAWSASVLVFFSGHYLNALKLRMLVGPGPGVTSACVRAQYAGLVANLSLPGLAGGDVIRAAYLVPHVGLPRAAAAGIADRVIDTATLLVLVAVALPLAGVPAAIGRLIHDAGIWIAVALAATAVVVVALLRSQRFEGQARKVTGSLKALVADRSSLAVAVAISLVVQSAFVMTNVWLARQVGVTTGLAAWFVAWPLSKLIAVLPISLGGIGVREAALVSLLAPYGASEEAVLASGILWQAVLIVTGIAGLVVTQLWPRAKA